MRKTDCQVKAEGVCDIAARVGSSLGHELKSWDLVLQAIGKPGKILDWKV